MTRAPLRPGRPPLSGPGEGHQPGGTHQDGDQLGRGGARRHRAGDATRRTGRRSAPAPTRRQPPAACADSRSAKATTTTIRTAGGWRRSPLRTASVRLPAGSSVGMSRRLLATRMAAASRPITTEATQASRGADAIERVAAAHGHHRPEEHEDRHLTQSRARRRAGAPAVAEGGHHRRHPDEQHLRAGHPRRHTGPHRVATATTTAMPPAHLPGCYQPGGHRPGRSGAVLGVHAAYGVLEVVGEVDRHLEQGGHREDGEEDVEPGIPRRRRRERRPPPPGSPTPTGSPGGQPAARPAFGRSRCPVTLSSARGTSGSRGGRFPTNAPPSLHRLVDPVGEPGGLTGEELLADQPVVGQVEGVLEHPLRSRALGR